MIAEGADIIDIGAESTRPYGSQPVSADEELQRLQPVLAEIVALGVPVSIDSMKSAVVAWALDAGRRDRQRRLGPAARPRHGARWWRSATCPSSSCTTATAPMPPSTSCRISPRSSTRSLEIAAKAGISRDNIVLDPGIGFGKTPEQSMIALARLDELERVRPAAAGRRLAQALHRQVTPSEPQQRLGGSIAAHLLAARRGARIIRAHDVAETVQALRVAAAIEDKR